MTGVRATVRTHLAFVLVDATSVMLLHEAMWTVALVVLAVLRNTFTGEAGGVQAGIAFNNFQILLRPHASFQIQRQVKAIRTATLEASLLLSLIAIDTLVRTGDFIGHLQVLATVLFAISLVVAQVIVLRTGALVRTRTIRARVRTDLGRPNLRLAVLQLLLILVLFALVNVNAGLLVLRQLIAIRTVALEATLQVHAVVAAMLHFLALIDVYVV